MERLGELDVDWDLILAVKFDEISYKDLAPENASKKELQTLRTRVSRSVRDIRKSPRIAELFEFYVELCQDDESRKYLAQLICREIVERFGNEASHRRYLNGEEGPDTGPLSGGTGGEGLGQA